MASIPKVGFVSLGCPKALVDSEQIITRLRAEGYGIVGSYHDAWSGSVVTSAVRRYRKDGCRSRSMEKYAMS